MGGKRPMTLATNRDGFDPVTDVRRVVRKRDGSTIQGFDDGKIRKAISGAWKEVHGTVDDIAVQRVMQTVLSILSEGTVDVELVQDTVEVALMRHNHFPVAKA